MSQARSLVGKVALVTGASRGVGRGIALQLGEAGATVYVTGRRPEASLNSKEFGLSSLEKTANEIKQRGGDSVMVYCDHANTQDIKNLFAKISQENKGNLDILVNNAFAGAMSVVNVAGKKFFECEPELWDEINDVGLRSNYICSIFGARMMTKRQKGLIINVSSAGGLQYFFNVPYGVGKAAIDRMSTDMALELKPLGVTVVSLWPGFVSTELVEKTINSNSEILEKSTGLSKEVLESQWRNAETPEFVGKAVVALAKDRNVLKKTGKILMTTDLAAEYKFKDLNGSVPTHFRSVQSTLQFFGFLTLAKFIPSFLKIPKFILHFATYKF